MTIINFFKNNYLLYLTIIIFILYLFKLLFYKKNYYEYLDTNIKNLYRNISISTEQLLTDYSKNYVDKRLAYEQNVFYKSDIVKTNLNQTEIIKNNIFSNYTTAINISQNVVIAKEDAINAVAAKDEADKLLTQVSIENSSIKAVEAENSVNNAKTIAENSLNQVKNIYDNALTDSNSVNNYLTDANITLESVNKTLIDAQKLMDELIFNEKNSSEYVNLVDASNKVKNISQIIKDSLSVSKTESTTNTLQNLSNQAEQVIRDSDKTLLLLNNIFEKASSTGTEKVLAVKNSLKVQIDNLNNTKNIISDYVNKIQDAKNIIEAALIFINESLISANASVDAIINLINNKISITNNAKNEAENSLIYAQNQFKRLGFPISIKIINFNTGSVSIEFNQNYDVNIDGYFHLINKTKNKLISIGPNSDFTIGAYVWNVGSNLSSISSTTDNFQISKNNNPNDQNDNTNLSRISDTTIPKIICPFGYISSTANSNDCSLPYSQITFYSLINYGGISKTVDIINKNRFYIPFYTNSTCVTSLITPTDIKKDAIGFIPRSVKVDGKPINLIFSGFSNNTRTNCNKTFPIIPPQNYSNMNTTIKGTGYNWLIQYNKELSDSKGNPIPGTGTGGYFINII